jgi:superkiller protein 3
MEVLLRALTLRFPDAELGRVLTAAALMPSADDSALRLTGIKPGDPMDIGRAFRVEGQMETDKEMPLMRLAPMILARIFRQHDSIVMLLPSVEQGEVRLDGPVEYSAEMAIGFPEGAVGNLKPVHKVVTKDFADYESEYEWVVAPPGLHARWRLRLLTPPVSGSQTAEYADFVNEVADDFNMPRPPARRTSVADNKPPSGIAGRKINTTKEATEAHAAPPAAKALYDTGLADMKAGNYGNAEQSLQEAVGIDPAYAAAWNSLGRARMSLRKGREAEAAFRKYLELKPQEEQAYSNLGWALNAEEKYAQAVDELERHLATAAGDGDSQRHLGNAYLHLKKPEQAAPVLERAVALQPKNSTAHFLLGQAYVRLGQGDPAAKALETAVTLNQSGTMLNSAAYNLAKTKSHLDLAESWAARALSEVELQLNQSNLQGSVAGGSANLAGLLRQAHLYWDTLGFIKYQKGEMAAAEKYFLAAWQLADDTTAGAHLGRAQEAQGRKAEAVETLAQVVAILPEKRRMSGVTAPDNTADDSEDETDARQRLIALLGDDELAEAKVKEALGRARTRHSVMIENPTHAEGIVEYRVLIGPDFKVMEFRASVPDDTLEPAANGLKKAIMPQSFPAANITRIPQTGVLACPRADQPCRFTLKAAD